AFRCHRGFGGLEADLGMGSVTKRLGDRCAAPAQEHTLLARDIEQIAVTIAQVELAEIPRHQIGAVFRRHDFKSHAILLLRPASMRDQRVTLLLFPTWIAPPLVSLSFGRAPRARPAPSSSLQRLINHRNLII